MWRLAQAPSWVVAVIGLLCGVLGYIIGLVLFAGPDVRGLRAEPLATRDSGQQESANLQRNREASASAGASRASIEVVEGGWSVPTDILRKGSISTLSGWELTDDVIELLELNEDEVKRVSAVMRETYEKFGSAFLTAAKIEGPVTDAGATIRIPAISATGMEHLRRFENSLVDALGEDRATQFRAYTDRFLGRYLAGFGSVDQEITIINDGERIRFNRYAIDPDSGERKKNSRIASTSWDVDDEEVRTDYEVTQDMGLVSELFKLIGWW